MHIVQLYYRIIIFFAVILATRIIEGKVTINQISAYDLRI